MSSNVDKIDTGKVTKLYCPTYSVVSTLCIITICTKIVCINTICTNVHMCIITKYFSYVRVLLKPLKNRVQLLIWSDNKCYFLVKSRKIIFLCVPSCRGAPGGRQSRWQATPRRPSCRTRALSEGEQMAMCAHSSPQTGLVYTFARQTGTAPFAHHKLNIDSKLVYDRI